MQTIVINTDASFNHVFEVGGWAFWIEALYTKPLQYSGEFRTDVTDPSLAELKCIANALTVAANNYAFKGATVILCTDSMSSKHLITGGTKTKKWEAEVVAYIKDIVRDCKKFTIVHVPAHTLRSGESSADPQIIANDWCDKEARRHMRNAVRRKKYAKTIKARKRRAVGATRLNKQRQKTTNGRMGKRRSVPYKRTARNFDELFAS